MNDQDREESKAIVAQDEFALVPSNPRLQAIAQRFKWSPEKTIARIKRVLPALVEQQIYLAVASDFGIHPESLAKLLRMYLGYQELQLHDLSPVSVGKNLKISRFNSFAEFLRECLYLLKVIRDEYVAFSLGVEEAGDIVLNFGIDHPEILIEMVDGNLEELCDLFGINNKISYAKRMRTCIWIVVKKIIPENRKRGCPDLLNISELFELPSARQRELRISIADDLPDYLSDARGAFDYLKREGLL